MGAKRPLPEQDIPEISFKQPKQLDFDKSLPLKTGELPFHGVPLTIDSPAERNLCQSEFDEKLEGDTDAACAVDQELEATTPLSLTTSSSSEEDAGNEDNSFWSQFPAFVDFSLPRESLGQFEDTYISLFSCPPRKEVPVGPDHQAEVPFWDPSANGNFVDYDREERLMGTCVIPMPDLNSSSIGCYDIGRGRRDCICLDMGSLRCVQQHVKEAREKLRETIGDEKFLELGFFDMGEDVTCNWTADDERVFNDVIFCNPASHGKNFWKHLSAAFPTRMKHEIVSYYFNVFILRRRAMQNRSYLLDIDTDNDDDWRGTQGPFNPTCILSNADSDDDHSEGQGSHGGFHLIKEEDEDSAVESFGDGNFDLGWLEDDCWSERKHACAGEIINGNHGISDGSADGSSDGNRGISDGNVDERDGVQLEGCNRKTSGEETKEEV